jgi:flagellar basal body rod protein FlgC
MSEFDLLTVAADGMNVQRTLLDVAARNVAAAQASSPQHPYPRLVARFASPAPEDPRRAVESGPPRGHFKVDQAG